MRKNSRNENFYLDQERKNDQWLIAFMFVALITILILYFTSKRLKYIGPLVCPTMCSMKGERYYVWEEDKSGLGINCVCKTIPGRKRKMPIP
jgi:hypothetical protein